MTRTTQMAPITGQNRTSEEPNAQTCPLPEPVQYTPLSFYCYLHQHLHQLTPYRDPANAVASSSGLNIRHCLLACKCIGVRRLQVLLKENIIFNSVVELALQLVGLRLAIPHLLGEGLLDFPPPDFCQLCFSVLGCWPAQYVCGLPRPSRQQ